MSEEGKEKDFLTVGDFLEEHYSQFAIMGIFGTVSVFLSSNFPGGTSGIEARAGIFASLIIFAFTAAWLCWRALTELFDGLHEGHRPFGTEVGYTLIVLCTATLALTIGSATSEYVEVLKLAESIAVFSFGALLFVRTYPIERYNRKARSAGDIAFISALLLVFVLVSLGDGIQFAFRRHISHSFLNDMTFVVFLISLHITLSEAYLALISLYVEFEFSPERWREDWQRSTPFNPWSFPVSIAVSSISLSVFLGGMSLLSDKYGAGAGYFAVLGVYWKELVFYHYAMFSVIVAYTVLKLDTSDKIVRVSAIVFSALVTVIVFVELILAWNGTIASHVIRF